MGEKHRADRARRLIEGRVHASVSEAHGHGTTPSPYWATRFWVSVRSRPGLSLVLTYKLVGPNPGHCSDEFDMCKSPA